eukprot:RCo029140
MRSSLEPSRRPLHPTGKRSCPFRICPCGPSTSGCLPKRCQLPVWLMMVVLSSLSLVLVGALIYELTLSRSLKSVDYISVEYREKKPTEIQKEQNKRKNTKSKKNQTTKKKQEKQGQPRKD